MAWLSLDEGDSDPARFLTYLVAALRTIAPNIGEGVLGVLQSPQPPPIESILTALLNEITTIPDHFVLVLDDYHVLDAKPIDHALTFLLDHLPPQMHLVITTREDPALPLARLRAGGHLTEVRAADLRFTPSEAAAFLNQVMGLDLSAQDIAALETRTEGWIAGLQLAAISLQGHQDATSFIRSFTGSHHFVLDYLVEEVLGQQPESVQTFLLRTSILDRLCGPLCDVVLMDPSVSGQETLEYLERANLFIVPLDNERRWYRYHHLFADLLRQRLHQSTASSTGDERDGVAELHIRASQWYEDNGLAIEAFHHAVAANDVERAERLIEGKGMPLQFRGAMISVLNWLESLPTTILDARPSLWVTYASALTMTGQPNSRSKRNYKLLKLPCKRPSQMTKPETLSDILPPYGPCWLSLPTRWKPSLPSRGAPWSICTPTTCLSALPLPGRWGMPISSRETVPRPAGPIPKSYLSARHLEIFIVTIAATTCLGQVQEAENQLSLAAESYRRVLQLAGDPPLADCLRSVSWPGPCMLPME